MAAILKLPEEALELVCSLLDDQPARASLRLVCARLRRAVNATVISVAVQLSDGVFITCNGMHATQSRTLSERFPAACCVRLVGMDAAQSPKAIAQLEQLPAGCWRGVAELDTDFSAHLCPPALTAAALAAAARLCPALEAAAAPLAAAPLRALAAAAGSLQRLAALVAAEQQGGCCAAPHGAPNATRDGVCNALAALTGLASLELRQHAGPPPSPHDTPHHAASRADAALLGLAAALPRLCALSRLDLPLSVGALPSLGGCTGLKDLVVSLDFDSLAVAGAMPSLGVVGSVTRLRVADSRSSISSSSDDNASSTTSSPDLHINHDIGGHSLTATPPTPGAVLEDDLEAIAAAFPNLRSLDLACDAVLLGPCAAAMTGLRRLRARASKGLLAGDALARLAPALEVLQLDGTYDLQRRGGGGGGSSRWEGHGALRELVLRAAAFHLCSCPPGGHATARHAVVAAQGDWGPARGDGGCGGSSHRDDEVDLSCLPYDRTQAADLSLLSALPALRSLSVGLEAGACSGRTAAAAAGAARLRGWAKGWSQLVSLQLGGVAASGGQCFDVGGALAALGRRLGPTLRRLHLEPCAFVAGARFAALPECLAVCLPRFIVLESLRVGIEAFYGLQQPGEEGPRCGASGGARMQGSGSGPEPDGCWCCGVGPRDADEEVNWLTAELIQEVGAVFAGPLRPASLAGVNLRLPRSRCCPGSGEGAGAVFEQAQVVMARVGVSVELF